MGADLCKLLEKTLKPPSGSNGLIFVSVEHHKITQSYYSHHYSLVAGSHSDSIFPPLQSKGITIIDDVINPKYDIPKCEEIKNKCQRA